MVAVAIGDLHGGGPRVGQVEVLEDRTAPSVAKVPDQGVGVLERVLGDELFERSLVGIAGIAPDVGTLWVT